MKTADSILRKHLIAKLKIGANFSKDEAEAIKLAMIEFAKLHVQAQREAIKEELSRGLETFDLSLTEDFLLETTGNSLIDDAYPVINIV